MADPRQLLCDWLEPKKNLRGDHGLSERAHSDRDPRGDHGEWVRCIGPGESTVWMAGHVNVVDAET